MSVVSEIEVKYMRKVQVKEYEPAEASVFFKVHPEEGEDAVEISKAYIHESKQIVSQVLMGGNTTAVQGTVTTTTASPPQSNKATVNKKSPAKVDMTAVDSTEGESTTVEKPKTRGRPKKVDITAVTDVTEEDESLGEQETPSNQDSDTVVSHSDVQKFITDSIRNKKLTQDTIKNIMSEEFGATRTREIDESRCVEFIDRLKEEIGS